MHVIMLALFYVSVPHFQELRVNISIQTDNMRFWKEGPPFEGEFIF